MKLIFENKEKNTPKVSVILLDWSCRESFHILEYLNNQNINRQNYEIIWIEYYDTRPVEIYKSLKNVGTQKKHPALDKWLVMDMPKDAYYHKHLMYNIGILLARGEIVTICDSDAFMSPTFVQSIINSFKVDSNIVLHLDEVRNTNKKFYPFNHPSFEEVIRSGSINWRSGKTLGLLDKKDFLHTRNYGACMSALKSDLIDIGGADEHIDYLGHICGPYELTFRLINSGKKEVWHEKEFIYHVWHPGSDGRNNYLGPHDGKNMSLTALEVLKNGRVFALLENPAIRKARLHREYQIDTSSLLLEALDKNRIDKWRMSKLKIVVKGNTNKLFSKARLLISNPGYYLMRLKTKLLLFCLLLDLSLRQLYFKFSHNASKQDLGLRRNLLFNLIISFVFLRRMFKNNLFVARLLKQKLKQLAAEGENEVVFYGKTEVLKLAILFAKEVSIKISGIYDNNSAESSFLGYPVFSSAALPKYKGKIIISYLRNIKDKVGELVNLGLNEDNIIKLN